MAAKQDENGMAEDWHDDDERSNGDRMVPPLHWKEPKLHPEIVAHGAELARLAVELTRLEHGRGNKDVSPLDCLHDAGMLLQRAMELVPATANLSKPDRQEYDRWMSDHLRKRFADNTVPWKVICSEGRRAEDAPKTTLHLHINGQRVTYEWKAYVQIEKEGGLKALLLKHAMRVCFHDAGQRWRVRAVERILAIWAFHHMRRRWFEEQRKAWWRRRLERRRSLAKRREAYLGGLSEPKAKDVEHAWKEQRKRRKMTRSLKALARHPDLEWTVPFFKQATKELPNTTSWPSREWRTGLVQAWQELSAKDFAGRLLKWAQAGELRAVDFKSIATTRKLNPPGGKLRGNSKGR